MSFNTKLSRACKAANHLELDGMEVYTWWPDGGELAFDYGDDIDFPEKARAKDQDIIVNDDGTAHIQVEDLDADDMDLDETPTKTMTIQFMMNRPLEQGDLQ